MINHDHKFIFVHIPKTGGTSVSNILGSYFKLQKNEYDYWDSDLNHYHQHLFMSEIIDSHKKVNFQDYFKFSFIRNPWERAISEFFWRSKKNNIFCVNTFKNFLLSSRPTIEKSDPKRHIDSQYKFLFNEKGDCIVDFIGRFENLQNDFDIVCDKIYIPKQKLPHSNKSKHKHYTEYYDDEAREIVAEKYAKDIEMFGYKFGE